MGKWHLEDRGDEGLVNAVYPIQWDECGSDSLLPFHQLCSGEVGGHGLVVLTLHSKRMAVSNPCRAVRPLQSGGFALREKGKNKYKQPGRQPQTACSLLGLCKYKPQVSPCMFILMADHEIVAANSEPGHLGKWFYFVVKY